MGSSSFLNFLLWLYFVAPHRAAGHRVGSGLQPGLATAGVVLVIAEALFTVTDPAVRLLRRLIPPLRIGGASVDLSMLALLLGGLAPHECHRRPRAVAFGVLSQAQRRSVGDPPLGTLGSLRYGGPDPSG